MARRTSTSSTKQATSPVPSNVSPISSLHKTILAVQHENEQIGFAFYDCEDHALFVASRDFIENPSIHFNLVQKVKALVSPSMMITHHRYTEPFMNALTTPVGHVSIPIELVPWHDFAPKSSKTKLIQLQAKWLESSISSSGLPSTTNSVIESISETRPPHFHWADISMQAEVILLAKFNFLHSPLTLGCIGALLAFLNKLEDDSNAPDFHESEEMNLSPWDILDLKLFQLEDYMHLHPYDLEALNIFTDPSSRIKFPSSVFGK